MRRLSRNFLVMSALLVEPRPDLTVAPPASGLPLRVHGKMAGKDKLFARFLGLVRCRISLPMKTVVPCIVLGASVLSTAALFVVSVLLLG